MTGGKLTPSPRILADYQREWDAIVTDIWQEARPAILRDVEKDRVGILQPGTMDAAGDTEPFLLPGLLSVWKRFKDRLEGVAGRMAASMVQSVDKSSATKVRTSLKEMSKDISVRYDVTESLDIAIQQRIEENVRLITRLPDQMLDKLSRDVYKAVTSGKGLAEVQVLMSEAYGGQSRWSKQVAMDQVNKAYMAINSERMKAAGVTMVEWVHRPLAREPRHYHELSHSKGGLNGLIFSLDEPPIINQVTGERGLPGQLPFCHCIMRPHLEI